MQKLQAYLKMLISTFNMFLLQQHDVSQGKSIQFYDINDFETNGNEYTKRSAWIRIHNV